MGILCKLCLYVVSWIASGQCFGPVVLLLLNISELSTILEKKLYGYADNFTLVSVVPSPIERVAVAESLNRDLNRVSEWCDL